MSAERLPGDAARDQLISATWREDKEPTLLSAERLPGDVAEDQLISTVRPASPMTAEKPGNKASTQLFAEQYAVAGHQQVSSSEAAGTLAAVKPATKASTQLSVGQLVSEEAAVAASCAYHSPAIWKPGELHCTGDFFFKFLAVLRIRIRIHMFLGLPDPDSLVRNMDSDPALDPDPDPSIIMQK